MQVLSRSLVQRIPTEHWRNCELMGPGSLGGGGADVRIPHCIWTAGYGPTLPMYRPGFDEFEGCVFGAWPNIHFEWFDAMKSIRENLVSACDSTCINHVRPSIAIQIFAFHASLWLVCYAGQVRCLNFFERSVIFREPKRDRAWRVAMVAHLQRGPGVVVILKTLDNYKSAHAPKSSL